jgi:hypothetical protein
LANAAAVVVVVADISALRAGHNQFMQAKMMVATME